jgi:hypothetical protein
MTYTSEVDFAFLIASATVAVVLIAMNPVALIALAFVSGILFSSAFAAATLSASAFASVFVVSSVHKPVAETSLLIGLNARWKETVVDVAAAAVAESHVGPAPEKHHQMQRPWLQHEHVAFDSLFLSPIWQHLELLPWIIV